MSEEVKLSAREESVLLAMADYLSIEHAAPFKHINGYVRSRHGDRDGCEPWNIRRAVRSLSRKGMTEFQRGLMSESTGMLMGSGYGVTHKGYVYAQKAFNAAHAKAKGQAS